MRPRLSLVAVLAAAVLAACASSPSPQGSAAESPPREPVGASAVEPNQGQSRIVATVKANVPPGPETPAIRDVAFATTDHGWILLEARAMETRDGGETWSFVDTTSFPNPGADFLDGRYGWSSSMKQDGFYRTQDAGKTWEKLPDPCPEHSRRPFSFISPTTGWLLCGFDEGAGAMSKRLYRTADGGLSWTLLGEALVGKNGEPSHGKEWPGGLDIGDYAGDLCFIDEYHGWYTGTRYGSFMATRDGGKTWQEVAAPSLRGSRLRFITPQVGYRFGLDTMQATPWVLTITRDSGKTWQQVYPRRQPLQLFYLDARTYIGELDGGLYRSNDEGESWRLLTRLPSPLVSISYTSRENAWALLGTEKERHLFRSADGGSTWRGVTSPEDLGPFVYVQGLNAETAIVWDNANRLLMTRDGGTSFTPVVAPYDQFGGHGLFFASAEKGWFSRGFQLHATVDGGKNWQRIPLPERWKAQGVTVGPDGRVWASIVDEVDQYTLKLLTLASGDGGKTWTYYDLGHFNQPWPVRRCGLSAICVDSGGYRYGIVSHDGGQTWRYYQR